MTKSRSFGTGHLARGYPLSLEQNQARIDSMRKQKQAMASIAKLKPVQLDWKTK